MRGGTALTRRLARQHARSCLVAQLAEFDPAAVRAWLAEQQIRLSNVAGPRKSENPGIQQMAYEAVLELLRSENPAKEESPGEIPGRSALSTLGVSRWARA